MAHIVAHLPAQYGTYYEPFLGAGSLFFLLQPERAVLNDACVELMSVYSAVRDNVDGALSVALAHPMNKEEFYRVRENPSPDEIIRAGDFLFLNRACFNGLYRVNASGKFNVPWGAPKSSFVVDSENLRACSVALAKPGVRLTAGDFGDALEGPVAGDLVFLDPPYVTRHNNNGFVDYNERLFSWRDQQRLASKAEALRRRGCHVVVTNANHADVLALYPGFRAHEITRSSTLAGAAARRGTVTEALLVGKL